MTSTTDLRTCTKYVEYSFLFSSVQVQEVLKFAKTHGSYSPK